MGIADHPLYGIHRGMITRCHHPWDQSFASYGCYGIKVCDRWRHGEDGRSGFELFVEDMGPRPSPAHTIDREDNGGDYTPKNCRWATWDQQMLNRGGKGNPKGSWEGARAVSQAFPDLDPHSDAFWQKVREVTGTTKEDMRRYINAMDGGHLDIPPIGKFRISAIEHKLIDPLQSAAAEVMLLWNGEDKTWLISWTDGTSAHSVTGADLLEAINAYCRETGKRP